MGLFWEDGGKGRDPQEEVRAIQEAYRVMRIANGATSATAPI